MGRIKDEAFFQMVHDYLKIYLPSQMCASSNTVRAYRIALDQLIGYAASANGISISEVTFNLLDSGTVSGYLDWLVAEKGCSASTSLPASVLFSVTQRQSIRRTSSCRQDLIRYQGRNRKNFRAWIT